MFVILQCHTIQQVDTAGLNLQDLELFYAQLVGLRADYDDADIAFPFEEKLSEVRRDYDARRLARLKAEIKAKNQQLLALRPEKAAQQLEATIRDLEEQLGKLGKG